jgi:sec-independent protein translocase protein TatA
MTDVVIVLFVALLVFAATQIPAIGDALGRAVKGSRRAPRAPRDAPRDRAADDVRDADDSPPARRGGS